MTRRLCAVREQAGVAQVWVLRRGSPAPHAGARGAWEVPPHRVGHGRHRVQALGEEAPGGLMDGRHGARRSDSARGGRARPAGVCPVRPRDPRPGCGPGRGPVAMPPAEREGRRGRARPHPGHPRWPPRPRLGPGGPDCGDGRRVPGGLALGVVRYGPTLPGQPGIQPPHAEGNHPVLAQWARESARGHREGRHDTGLALGCREWARQRRRARRWGCCAPQARASWAAASWALEQRMTSETTRG